MAEVFAPTMFEQNMFHVFNILVFVTLFAPIILYHYLKGYPGRLSWQRFLAIQWGLEAILTAILAFNFLYVYQATTISAYEAQITIYLIFLFIYQPGMTIQFYRLVKKQRLTRPPPLPDSGLARA